MGPQVSDCGEDPGIDGERFIPFPALLPAVHKIIYTTKALESLNYQLRKFIKIRGHFPNDRAAVQLLWLAICNIADKRARERIRLRGDRLTPRIGRTTDRLVEVDKLGSATTPYPVILT